MKKLFLKSFALVAMLLCGLTASAKQYCHEQLTSKSGDKSIYLTCEKLADGTYQMTIEGESLNGFGGSFFNPGNVDLRSTITSSTPKQIVCSIKAESAPSLYTPLYVMMPGEVAFDWPKDIEWGTCGGGEEKETIEPTMTSATLAEVSHNAAVINVAGTDKESDDGETIAVSKFKVVYGETTKTYTATDGKIKIEGLELNKTYTFTIYAVDAAGNVSKEGLTVEATTALDWSKVSYIGSSAGAEYTNQYKVVVVSGKVTIDVIQNPAQTTEPGIYCILPGAVSSLPIAGKTEGAGAWLYLSAFSKQETEVVIPYVGGSTTVMVYNEKGFVGDDSQKPVMVKAELVSNTYNSAVIAVEATDNLGVASYKVVDEANAFNANFAAVDGKITVTGLTPGTTYNLAISAVDLVGNVSEKAISVQVKTPMYSPAPTTAAPVPVHEAANVKSIYSDTYTPAWKGLNSYNETWWSNPSLDEKDIDGNKFLRYYGNMAGMIGWQFTPIDATGMTHLHVDIWPSVTGTMTMGPTYGGDGLTTHVESVVLEVVQEKWNSFDIDLNEHKNLNLTSIFQNQFKGYSAQSEFSVDNVYFWKDGTSTAVDANEVATKVSKRIENGQVVIIREGVKYNVVGAVIEK